MEHVQAASQDGSEASCARAMPPGCNDTVATTLTKKKVKETTCAAQQQRRPRVNKGVLHGRAKWDFCVATLEKVEMHVSEESSCLHLQCTRRMRTWYSLLQLAVVYLLRMLDKNRVHLAQPSPATKV
ncbi:hypothetical protein TRVL_06681 [Trypanosoma vivax]|nr:hypothetical protein TRVL_06681 [Trypanosoma vivax]